METNLISIIGAIIILAVVIGAVYFSIKNKKDNGAKEAAEFMNGLCDEIIKIIFQTIGSFDPKTYKTAEEFEVVVLNAIYDKVWEYTKSQINANFDDNSTLKLIMNTINKDYVVKFVDNICEKSGITDKIQGKYAAYQIETNKAVEIDKSMEKEYSDTSKYNTEEVKDEDLEPAKEESHTEEEIKALKPQRDEEESYDPEDASMEVIDDGEETKKNIIGIKNKAGNILYYEVDEDGKKKRVTKEYAISIIGDKIDEIDLSQDASNEESPAEEEPKKEEV